LLLMLSAAACATPPAPQIAAPPPGQARIWFYRLWDPSELEVLDRPYIVAATIPALREGVARMLAAAELLPIGERIAACRDPTDDKFLELAVKRPCGPDRFRRRGFARA
jgi:hypothetical protein